MPDPVAITQRGDGWVVVCRLCDFVSESFRDYETPRDWEVVGHVAHEHVVEAHPEVTQP